MKKIQMSALKKIASIGKFAAIKAAGTTSWASCHQPKEPEALRKLCKTK